MDCDETVLVEPGCCSDLGDVSNWKTAVNSTASDWSMLWIGHPWLSYRSYETFVEISGTHESDAPVGRWKISPAELDRAFSVAVAEQVAFAERVATVLPKLGCTIAPHAMARKLAGLG